MVKEIGRVLEFNVRTKERKEYEMEFDFPHEPMEEIPPGIDPEKLKQVLLDAGVIQDIKEIEPEVEVVKEPIT